MPSLLGGLVKARLGYAQGEDDREQKAAEQAAQQAEAERLRSRDAMTRALNEMTLEKGKRDLAAPPPVRNIDPLSPDGIRATVDRERQLAPFKAAAQPKAPAPVKTTVEERKAGALLIMARDAGPLLDTVTAPSRPDSWKAGLGFNEALSKERQIAEQAGLQFMDAYLRLVSGANLPDGEIAKKAREIIPQPGDLPETVARKKAARAKMMQAMELASGGAVEQANAASAPPKAPKGTVDTGYPDIDDAYIQFLAQGRDPKEAMALVQQAVAIRQKRGGGK